MMNTVRPRNPDVLLRAVRMIFGVSCLRCGISRPDPVMAHIRNWPGTLKVVTTKMKGSVPETEKFTKVIDEYTYSLFHNIGNVLPLCPNCHALFDGAKYTESDEREIRQLRDEAVRQPEVLEQAIAYIRAELAGRTNRCSHKDEAGDRLHTRRTDTSALGAPLTWVMNGFRRGLDLGDPNIVVNTATPGQHYHVALDRGSVDQCFGTSDSGCSDSELVV